MTSEEFAAIAKKDPVVLLPVGALEEHGRHLPLGADLIQPLHVLEDVPNPEGPPRSGEGQEPRGEERHPRVRHRTGSAEVLVRGDGGPVEGVEGARPEARRPRDRRTRPARRGAPAESVTWRPRRSSSGRPPRPRSNV